MKHRDGREPRSMREEPARILEKGIAVNWFRNIAGLDLNAFRFEGGDEFIARATHARKFQPHEAEPKTMGIPCVNGREDHRRWGELAEVAEQASAEGDVAGDDGR